MCDASPVALRLWHDTQVRYGDRVRYAGIVASAQHAADCHPSGHNCADICGGQESPLDGIAYDGRYAYALDINIRGDKALGTEIAQLLIHDPRTRYVIWDGVGYYGAGHPDHQVGETFDSFDHTDHVHWSGTPTSTFDTSPFYLTGEDLTIMDAATKAYFDEEFANITNRDAAIQHALDDEQDGVIQKSRRLVMEALFLPRKADGTPDMAHASDELKDYVAKHSLTV